jgi:hypothetical protein
MRRFSLLFVILGSVAVAGLLTWIALTSASLRVGPRPAAPVERTGAPPQALPPFTRLEVSGTAEILLVQGAAESIAIARDAGSTGQVDAEVRDGTLHIEATDNARWWELMFGRGNKATSQIVVTFRDLSAIDAAGTVRLTAGALKTDELRIAGAGGTAIRIDALTARSLQLAGAGALRADLAGQVTDQTVTITGAGEYRGAKLVSQNATVTVAGAGQVVINAEQALRADISGAGSVDYLGNPKVTEHVSGVGRVRRRET